MPDPPLVTIVIPTWNRCELVQEAVASVRAQRFADWELVVVDDGSDDDTVERLAAIGDPRVRAIALPHSGNMSYLRNVGSAAGSGPWLAFLDSDDLWLPQKLQRQLEAVEAAGAGWCYTDHGLIDEDGNERPIRAGTFRPIAGNITRAILEDQTSASVGTLLVRRSLFESVGRFDESLWNRADVDLVLRLGMAADAAVVAERLVLVREHAGRTTAGLSDPHERTARVFAKFASNCGDSALARLARRRCGKELANAGARRLAAGEIRAGLRLIGGAARRGAPLEVWLGALARGLRRFARS